MDRFWIAGSQIREIEKELSAQKLNSEAIESLLEYYLESEKAISAIVGQFYLSSTFDYCKNALVNTSSDNSLGHVVDKISTLYSSRVVEHLMQYICGYIGISDPLEETRIADGHKTSNDIGADAGSKYSYSKKDLEVLNSDPESKPKKFSWRVSTTSGKKVDTLLVLVECLEKYTDKAKGCLAFVCGIEIHITSDDIGYVKFAGHEKRTVVLNSTNSSHDLQYSVDIRERLQITGKEHFFRIHLGRPKANWSSKPELLEFSIDGNTIYKKNKFY